MMSLEEEIVIVQFGQGVLSYDAVRRTLAGFNDEKKTLLLVSSLAGSLDPGESDAEQAIRDSSLDASFEPTVWMRDSKMNRLGIIFLDALDQQNQEFLFYLFKATYQRYAASEKEYPSRWWHSDLSNNEVVQNILTSHNKLVEEIYNNTSFRSEFAALAKLHYNDKVVIKAESQPLDARPQKKFNFLTYSEREAAYSNAYNSMTNRAQWLLQNALSKAFLKHYDIDTKQATRVMYEIIDRYMRENYNTGL